MQTSITQNTVIWIKIGLKIYIEVLVIQYARLY